MAIVISADEIKKELPNYSPDKVEEFHHESARQADKLFAKVLKESSYKEVILLNGGTASGKTEFLDTQLKNKKYIIMDATLATEEFARNKIREIIKAGKIPIIYAVIPDDLRRALLWIAKNYPNIEINIVESSYTKDDRMQFRKINLSRPLKLINFWF